MSVIAAALKHMLAAGMQADAIVAAVAEMEEAMPTTEAAPRRSKAAERTARWRARKEAEEASQTVTDHHETSPNVTDVTTPFLSPPPSPRPLSTTTNLSPEPPIVPQTKGRKRPVRRAYSAEFETCWKAYPHHECRSSKPNSADEFDRLPAEEQTALAAAIIRFKGRVAETCGGKGAPDMARWLKDGKHLAWIEQGARLSEAASIPKFPNAAIRDFVVRTKGKGEAWAVSYLDPCAYAEDGEARTITAPNSFTASKLKADVPELEQRGIRIVLPPLRSAS